MMASGIGELRDLPGHPVGDQRALSQSGLLTIWRAQRARLVGDFFALLGALGRLLLERRRHQLLDRGDQVVEPEADVGDQRHLGEHDVAHAVVVDPHVDEFRAARHDRRRRRCAASCCRR